MVAPEYGREAQRSQKVGDARPDGWGPHQQPASSPYRPRPKAPLLRALAVPASPVAVAFQIADLAALTTSPPDPLATTVHYKGTRPGGPMSGVRPATQRLTDQDRELVKRFINGLLLSHEAKRLAA